MIPYKTYAVVGGDLRQAHIANLLAAQGRTVCALLLEQNTTIDPALFRTGPVEAILHDCDVVIFPLPLSLDDKTVHAPFSDQKLLLEDCFSALKPDAQVFAGKVNDVVSELASQKGVTLCDYLEREELAVKNAVITAEGALAIAMEELPVSISGLECLITGYGRIARALIRILRGMGARVTAAARKQGALAEIEAEGCRAVHISALPREIGKAGLILNTVPSHIFEREALANMKSDALLIDLASKPGGAGFGWGRIL